MPTLREYARAMIAMCPEVGQVVPVTSLTTTTVVSAALAVGGLDSAALQGQWMTRREAAPSTPADRVRRITLFTSSTGTLTQAGTNYADTTATGESLEVSPYSPQRFDNAIQYALGYLHRQDRVILPTVQGQERYWLGDFDWLRSPRQITGWKYRSDPNIVRNRYFERWSSINSSGVITPADWWVVFGSGATTTRSTNSFRGRYAAAVTRSGTDCYLFQTVGLLEGGVSLETLRGKTVTFGGRLYATVADRGRISLSDGITTTTTSYHSGGSTWEELTATKTISASATTLEIRIEVNTGNTAVVADEAWCQEGTYGDAERRNAQPEESLKRGDYSYDQGAPVQAVYLPARSRGGQYVMESLRPYPQFSPSRVAAGTADDDSNDAPLNVVAAIALWRLFDGLAAGVNKADQSKYAMNADLWRRRGQELAAGQIYEEEGPRGGLNILPPTFMPSAVRFRRR